MRMTIAIDARGIENDITGVGRYLSNLLRYWQHEKDVRFLLYFKDRIPSWPFMQSANMEAVLLKQQRPSNAMWQHIVLPRQLRRDKPDIFFSPSYILPISYGGKTAVVLHDIFYEAHPEWCAPAERLLLKTMSKISARKATHIFTVSEFSKKEIMRLYRLPAARITVTHLAVDDDLVRFSPSERGEKESPFRAKYGIPAGFFLFNGTVFTRRHPREMIRAFVMFKQKTGGNHRFIIAGRDGTYPQENVPKMAEKANKEMGENAILYMKYIPEEDLRVAYNCATAEISISDYEGFGLQPLEALKCGTPAIVSDSEVAREIMGDAALFIKSNSDVSEISVAMEKIEEATVRNKIMSRADDRLKKFSFDRCAQETLAALKKIAHA